MDANRKRNKPVLIVVLVIVVIIISLGVIGSLSTPNKTVADNTKISQEDAEDYCQDANLLGKYLNLNKISIIDVLNNNTQFNDSGSYDKNGNHIMILTWNGHDDSTDQDVGFGCWVSGKKDNVTLHWLSCNGTDLYGSAKFESYDKNGKLEK